MRARQRELSFSARAHNRFYIYDKISRNAAKYPGTPFAGGRNHACWLIIRVNPRSLRLHLKSINVESFLSLHFFFQKAISVFSKVIKSSRAIPFTHRWLHDFSFYDSEEIELKSN